MTMTETLTERYHRHKARYFRPPSKFTVTREQFNQLYHECVFATAFETSAPPASAEGTLVMGIPVEIVDVV